MPDIADEDVLGDAADPGELRSLEVDAGRGEQLGGRDIALHRGDDGAVARRLIGKIVGRREAVRAIHVLHDDQRMAGKILGDVGRDQATEGVVGAARRRADNELDLLALVEVLHRVGGEGLGRKGGKGQQAAGKAKRRKPRGHGILLPGCRGPHRVFERFLSYGAARPLPHGRSAMTFVKGGATIHPFVVDSGHEMENPPCPDTRPCCPSPAPS